jgi:hypothetical protein
MMREYGQERFWLDGTSDHGQPSSAHAAQPQAYDLVRPDKQRHLIALRNQRFLHFFQQMVISISASGGYWPQSVRC